MKGISWWVKKTVCHLRNQNEVSQRPLWLLMYEILLWARLKLRGMHYSIKKILSLRKWVTICQEPVTPTEQVFQVSMDTVLSCHEPHWNKESNHQIVKRRTRRWWGFAKGISNARWETNDLSRRQALSEVLPRASNANRASIPGVDIHSLVLPWATLKKEQPPNC